MSNVLSQWGCKLLAQTKLIGKHVILVNQHGCMAHVNTIDKIGVVKEIYNQRDRLPNANSTIMAYCEDPNGDYEPFKIPISSTWFQKLNKNTYIYYT